MVFYRLTCVCISDFRVTINLNNDRKISNLEITIATTGNFFKCLLEIELNKKIMV